MIACAIIATALAASAAAAPPAERASFDLYQGDRVIGVANWDRTVSGTTTLYRDRARFVHGGHQYVFRSETRLGPGSQPLHYELHALVDGYAQAATFDVRAGTAVMEAEVAGVRQRKEIAFAAPSLLLDNLVVHHYDVLARLLAEAGAAGPRSLPAYVPQKLLRVPVFVEPAGEETQGEGGVPVRVRVFRLRAGGERIELRVAADAPTLLSVAVPAQGLRLVRRARPAS